MKFWAFALYFTVLLGFVTKVNAQITGASCPESAQYYSKDSINVITFGASTVEGVNGFSFQPHLTSNFLKCYPSKTINIQKYGISGETTGDGLLRINNAIKNKTGFIAILMGANDAVQIAAGKLSVVETEANMRELIRRSLQQKLIPIICTIQNFDDRKSTQFKRVNYYVTKINIIYKNLAKEYGIYLADINAVMQRDFALYQDYVHPNARGNRLISFVLFDTINKIIAAKFLKFIVTQNYPNPGKESTSIDIIMPEADKIEFKLYNLQGKVIQTILNEYLNTGKHTIELSLRLLPAGVYIYRVASSNGLYTTSKKMVIMH
ncbi:MAG: GDSL-type esterase/lipase family protein [Bacteroidota bacterium]